MVSIIAPGSDGFGTDSGIQTQNPGFIQIVYRGQFNENACCLGDKTRRYFLGLENGFETNQPTACCCLPANCICNGTDHISKYYFDRGPYDQQGCLWWIGFFNGAPVMFPNEVQHVCLCMDCCQCWNEFIGFLSSCYIHCLCGDRVRYSPFKYWCWCIPAHAWWLTNCCSLCGAKNDQPLCLCHLEWCLRPGSAGDLVIAVENSRSAWRQRTGKP